MSDLWKAVRPTLGVAVVAGLTLAAEIAPAAPEPQPVARRWELDVTPGPLRVAIVDVAGVGPQMFYYFTYLVTNNAGQDLLFAPSFDLATDDGSVLRSGRDVPLAVTEEILRRLDNPSLHDQIGVIGMLLQGDANAREGLAIWPVEDVDVDALAVYSAGFSGETYTLDIPKAQTGEASRVVLRKSLMIRYDVPGTVIGQGDEPLAVIEKRWIMR